MGILQNLDFLTLGITIAAIGILGFVVFFNNPRSITNQTFLLFSILTIFYGLINYFSYQVASPQFALWLERVVIFFAVWHAFSAFQLFYVFPQRTIQFSTLYKKILVPAVMAVALFNLTPFVFGNLLRFNPQSHIVVVQTAPGAAVFGLFTLALVITGLIILVRKTLKAEGIEKKQLQLVSLGAFLTFFFIITLNLILPTVFNYVRFIPLAGLYFFPFVALTFYAMIRYQLLNIKVVATEVLTLVLAIATLFDVVTAPDLAAMLLRAGVFILIIVFSILLIKNILKEIEQREQLEILSKQLAAANDQLKILDQARAEFITIASHQLRTPPATIKWYMSALLDGDYGKFTDEQKDILEKTNRTNNSLISLIDDMLNVSRIERGKMEFLFEPTNLLDLANITFEQLEPIAKEKGLLLTFNRPLAVPEIMADKEKLRQVMNNMIDNALKYTKQGSVALDLSSNDHEIRFCVKDTGKGMSPEEKDEIFEKYKRGKESIKQSAGLGLGLYVAKVIVQQHQGKIWAESPGPGLGSSFIFTVPIHSGLQKTSLVDLSKAN